MGILDRFSDIAKANVNDVLDQCEEPAKMIDRYLDDLKGDLAEVRREIAGVIAEEERTGQMVEENAGQRERFARLARKALAAGNEDDARVFLAKKQELEAEGADLAVIYGAAHENADKMRQLHDKLVDDIEKLNVRRELIRAKVSVAKTQDLLNARAPLADEASGALGAFDRMEEVADTLLDRANAVAELERGTANRMVTLEEKYAGLRGNEAIETELSELKAEMDL